MNVNIEEPSHLRRKLTIEVEPDEIKRELDKAFNELKRGVVLKGFRPGHAPRNLLERFFGEQVRTEVMQKLVKEYTDKALEEHSLKPVVAPEIVTEETDLAKELALKFSATFDLRPTIEVKERALAHGVYEVLRGAEIGKEMRSGKTYPDDYSQKELAGKTIEWRATPKEIYRRELPNVDDDFAKDLGDESLDAFRTRVRSELLAHAQQEADARVRQGLLDLVIERNPVELPESLVARELSAMEAELHQTLEAGGLSHEEASERVKQSSEELKTRAEKRALTGL